MSCNFFGETSTIMPKRGETGNWVSPPLSVLCAHPRVPLSHTGFLPGPGHAGAAVLTFSPHFQEFIARWVLPLAASFPCCWAREGFRGAPPPLNRSNKPNTALLRKLPHRPNLLLLDWSRLVNPAADFLSSLSLLSSQINVVKSHKFYRHVEDWHNVVSWPTRFLGKESDFLGQKTVFLGQEVHYYMVYIAYFTGLKLRLRAKTTHLRRKL